MADSNNWGIHWFRRDLRVAGNQALRENFKKTEGKTLGIFCFDSKFLARDDFSANRFAFFMETLVELRKELRLLGGDLLIVDGQASAVFEKLFLYLDQTLKPRPSVISYSRDYEPFARVRDEKMSKLLKKYAIEEIVSRDHLLIEPEEIKKSDGSFYQIYSPYARRWFEALGSEAVKIRIETQSAAMSHYKKLKSGKVDPIFKMTWNPLTKLPQFPFVDALDVMKSKNVKRVSIPIPKAGFIHAYEQLLEYKEEVEHYLERRDFPSLNGTSRLSMYLKNGSLTSSQIMNVLDVGRLNFKRKNGEVQFVKEIAWREFYYSILFHRPDVENSSYLKQYENLKWENNKEWFERWKMGTTGFPIVDAGMRELNTTGFMHNRVRMIVASFLTKDLLIDWKWGENYFMKMLLDGDLAPHNGGWQWAASTGCDPQPYFRVFNPWTQGKKFDEDGEYIKKFIPELSTIPAKLLHDPDQNRSQWNYPEPIVDHGSQRKKAIALYQVKSR